MVVNLKAGGIQAVEGPREEGGGTGGGRAYAPIAECKDGATLSLAACYHLSPVFSLALVFVFVLALVFFSEEG